MIGILRVYQVERAWRALRRLAVGRDEAERLAMEEVEALYEELPDA